MRLLTEIGADYTNTYWNGKGKHQSLYTALFATIPTDGECPKDRPALELLRQAGNGIYELYNNGGCNRKGHKYLVPGSFISVNDFNSKDRKTAQFAIDQIERALNTLVLKAHYEAKRVAVKV